MPEISAFELEQFKKRQRERKKLQQTNKNLLKLADYYKINNAPQPRKKIDDPGILEVRRPEDRANYYKNTIYVDQLISRLKDHFSKDELTDKMIDDITTKLESLDANSVRLIMDALGLKKQFYESDSDKIEEDDEITKSIATIYDNIRNFGKKAENDNN